MIIDSHVHVGTWKFPSVEDYRAAMPEAGVTHAVLSQFVGNVDNRYLARCVTEQPDRFAAIAMVEHDTPGAVDQVRRLADSHRFVGVRLWASTRSPGPDPLALWRAIAGHGLVASVRGPLPDIADPDFSTLLEECPDLTVRIEHVGSAFFPSLAGARRDFDRLLELSRYPQMHVMWAGFYANSGTRYPYPDADPYLADLVAAYGAERICWGGDWNQPDPLDGHYRDAVRHVVERTYLTEEDKAWILGRTAQKIFGWPVNSDG